MPQNTNPVKNILLLSIIFKPDSFNILMLL